MRSKMVAALAAGALLLGACASSGEGTAPRASDDPPATPRPTAKDTKGERESRTPAPAPPEDPAPDFAFETFEGETFLFSEQRGRPIVLNFWESW